MEAGLLQKPLVSLPERLYRDWTRFVRNVMTDAVNSLQPFAVKAVACDSRPPGPWLANAVDEINLFQQRLSLKRREPSVQGLTEQCVSGGSQDLAQLEWAVL